MQPAALQAGPTEPRRLVLDVLLGVLPVLLLLALDLWSLTWLLEDWPLSWPTQLAVLAVLTLGLAAGLCLVALIFKPRPLKPNDGFVRYGRFLLPFGAFLAVIPGLSSLVFLGSINAWPEKVLMVAEALSSLLAIITALRYLHLLRHLGGFT
ncbi:hypothetical protein [Deinococcus alpinitundrae]|uniref:hypothetical protein n=1 Tax=Deinococcus alpinitundrae TaxID=468913 RepID=UPI00137999DA|nr:hypothetical protein [Deinococcus alpinitundrae]